MIHTIDCNYLYPRFAASYLVENSGRALFIDNNTTHSAPLLLKALSRAGLKPEAVEYLIITHVHLDHAGGTSALLRACPNAQVLAHPRAVRHLVDPSRLIAGAQTVYGVKDFERLYGRIEPIAETRVRAVADGETLSFGTNELQFVFTRGHANHHTCILLDRGPNSVIFTGDSFGLAYPSLQGSGLFVFPSTSPTDFDAAEARKSIQKILDTGARKAFLTHYGALEDLVGAAAQLNRAIDFSERLLEEAQTSALPDARLAPFCEERLRTWMGAELEARGMSGSAEAQALVKLDVELNAAGLAHVATQRRHPRQPKEA
jgi:glyoxylase-like metal-dependent hydrolase (beta-lactamase superfamily II)